MLVYQGRTSRLFQYLFTIDTRSFSIYICQWPHIPFVDGPGCWWTGNLPPSGSAPILPTPQPELHMVFRAPIQFCALTMASTVRYQGGVPFPFLIPLTHWSRWSSVESCRGHQDVSHGQIPTESEWEEDQSHQNFAYPASDWQIPCCFNKLPRGEDVKNLLMLRWENCMHVRFKPKLSWLYTKRKEGWQGPTSSLCLSLTWMNINARPSSYPVFPNVKTLKKNCIFSCLIWIHL